MSEDADPYALSSMNGARITTMTGNLRIGIAESSLFADVKGVVGL